MEMGEMDLHYNDIELISPQASAYLANNRRYKVKALRLKKYRQVDPFAMAFNKELYRWEYVVQRLLAKLVTEVETRILRYSENHKGHQYREIDFITQSDANTLTFCELKLKTQFKHHLNCKASGWRQLNKSIAVAGQKYQHLKGLSICVDMAAVYGLESDAGIQDYCPYQEITDYLLASSTFEQRPMIWVNSLDIARWAIHYQLLTQSDVDRMKQAYQEYHNPFLVLDGHVSKVGNSSAFQLLTQLKNEHMTNLSLQI